MSTVKYTQDHEWVRLEGAEATIGITDFAQSQLGDIVYVELPAIGRAIEKGKEAAVVESVKAASEVYAPLSGEITAINQSVADDPSRVNSDAAGEGWLFKLRLSQPAEVETLLDADAYTALIGDAH